MLGMRHAEQNDCGAHAGSSQTTHSVAAGGPINAVWYRQLSHPPVQNHSRLLKILDVWAFPRPAIQNLSPRAKPDFRGTRTAPFWLYFGKFFQFSVTGFLHEDGFAGIWHDSALESVPVSQLRTYRTAATLFEIFWRYLTAPVRSLLPFYTEF